MLGVDTDTQLLEEIVSLISESNSLQELGHRENTKNAKKYNAVYLDGEEITSRINGIQGDMLSDIMWSRGD